MCGVLRVGACGAGRARFTVGIARIVEPSCRTTQTPLGRRSRTRPLVGTQHFDLTKSRSDLPCTQRFNSRSSKKWIGSSEIHMLTHRHVCRAAAHGFRPAKLSSRRHACTMPSDRSRQSPARPEPTECKKEGRGLQRCWTGDAPGPGGACGVAPWSLCGAPAARRATGEPFAARMGKLSRALY